MNWSILKLTWWPTLLLTLMIGFLAAVQYTAVIIPSRNARQLFSIQQELDRRGAIVTRIDEQLRAIEARHEERTKQLQKLQTEIERLARRPPR